MDKKLNIKNIMVILILSCLIIFLGFKDNNVNNIPKEVYAIYLDGKQIGMVNSKKNLELYINKKEQTIKEKYKVDKVYTPKGVEIKKTYTYSSKVNTSEEIYNKLLKSKNFTIKGYTINITDPEVENYATKRIYVLNKNIFDEAVTNLIKTFLNEETYTKFMEGKQEEIIDYGQLVENIDIKQTVTYKEEYIPVNEQIFVDTSKLTQYLLYGTTKKQQTYIVKEGDTIEDVATANKLNVQEFLIANPEFTSANNLLYASQEVIVGLINPVIDIVVDVHSVEEVEKAYDTEIKYDENLVQGYEKIEVEGENGLDKVTKKYQYINGQLVDAFSVGSTNIKPVVNRVIVKGEKVIPNVADLSYWAWPTDYPYTITTYFAYRWGTFHSAIDIYVSYGSGIYAANNGTVETVVTGCTPGNTGCNGGQGNYIVINHNAGNYYTHYMHLASIFVSPGQTVSRGQKIATMGNTGYVVPTPSSYNPYGGTHLDFGLHIGRPHAGGKAIDPLVLYR